MYNQIISLENLFSAWQEFKRGKRGKPDVQIFERNLEDNIFQLHSDLSLDKYKHGDYHKFHVYDPKHRIIHKASVRDRLVHHAVHRVLYPFFDRPFIYDSYSCRVNKGTHKAVKRLEKFLRKASYNYRQSCFALKIDIKKFFDSVDHEILKEILKTKIDCNNINQLLSQIINSYSQAKNLRGGRLFETEKPCGIPLGNLTSQLYANIYMNAFDHFIKEKLKFRFYIRYTDDMVILHEDQEFLESLLSKIKTWLWENRKLKIHERKTSIKKANQGIDFLGYIVLPHYTVLRTKTKHRMLKRVNCENIQSYLGLLKHCKGYELRRNIGSIKHPQ